MGRPITAACLSLPSPEFQVPGTMDGMEHRPAGVLPVELTDLPIYEMSSETKHVDVLFAVG